MAEKQSKCVWAILSSGQKISATMGLRLLLLGLEGAHMFISIPAAGTVYRTFSSFLGLQDNHGIMITVNIVILGVCCNFWP